jgi:hypothetical protein
VVSCLASDNENFEFSNFNSQYGKKHVSAYRLGYSDHTNNIYAPMERFNRREYIKAPEGGTEMDTESKQRVERSIRECDFGLTNNLINLNAYK